MEKWIIRSSKTVFERKIYSINELECSHRNKNEHYKFTIMNTPDWINIVALTEDKSFIMVKQHRLGTDEITIETPAGLIEPEEDHKAAAHRELLEETGYHSSNLYLLKSLKANPAIMNTTVHIYAAEDCKKTNNQKLDDTEDIDVELIPKDRISQMIYSGKIDHSIVIAAISLYFWHKQDYVL